MGTDGSGSGSGGELDALESCEAAHYVVTNHRPGAVHLTARCSFLGPDTQVRQAAAEMGSAGFAGLDLNLWRESREGGVTSFCGRVGLIHLRAIGGQSWLLWEEGAHLSTF